MTEGTSWAWTVLFLLGTYHGVNPGMGWLFAVALGMQQESSRAVWRALLPIGLGHGLAIAAVVLLAALAQMVLPLRTLNISVALILFTFGLYRLLRNRHPRWGGMQVGFVDLAIWSFLMASAHGAGFMVLPVLLGMSGEEQTSLVETHHLTAASFRGSLTSLGAILVHTLGYLLVTGVVAVLVYEKLGLTLLRKAWLNLDLMWGVALLITAVLTLFL
jgi:hypothetical protein